LINHTEQAKQPAPYLLNQLTIMKKIFLFFTCLLLCVNFSVYAQKTVSITDFGVVPGSLNNVVPAVRKALASCYGQSGDVVLNFPEGRYDFWPSYCDDEKGATIGLNLYHQKNLTIEGNGAAFVFHGRMQIASIDSCENIVLRNFSVDWDRPYISQAEVAQATDTCLDVIIDKTLYPYVIEEGKIMFTGEGWKLPVVLHLLYDKDRKEIVPKTWDNALGNIFRQKAESLGNGIVRFWGKPAMTLEKGTYISLFHGSYMTNGIHIRSSKNTLLKDVTIYHALSNGVLGELSENITMDNTSLKNNEAKGRVFCNLADASHFVSCKGLIKIENCAHAGQGDDFVNIHGRNAMINKIINKRAIEIEVRKNNNFAMTGDEIWFIDAATVQRGEIRIVESMKPVYTGHELTGYRIDFTSDIPESCKLKDFIESKTWTPSVEIRNCIIAKKHRARGILVTTPKEVVIEHNYFRSAGTAILLEGDIDYWFEAGANNNVTIQNNIFEDCLTSGNTTGNRWEWGDAVITITPSHHPQNVTSEPYHKNIHIHDNVFKVFDAPLVRARSVRGLHFSNNEVIKTDTYTPFSWQKSAFLLDGCREVVIKDNKMDDQYTTRTILIEHMKKSDVKAERNQRFSIDDIPAGFNTYFNKPRYQ
jgi:hypothetical protein